MAINNWTFAIPYGAEEEVAKKIKEVANQKIVISISNTLNETYSGLIIALGTSVAQELQKLLSNSKVVKAFKTRFAADFSISVMDGKQVDTFLAGNHETALQGCGWTDKWRRFQSNYCRWFNSKQNIGNHVAFTYSA